MQGSAPFTLLKMSKHGPEAATGCCRSDTEDVPPESGPKSRPFGVLSLGIGANREEMMTSGVGLADMRLDLAYVHSYTRDNMVNLTFP